MLSIAKAKRQALFTKLAPNSIAILPGEIIKYRSNDTQYPFRQNSDFYYLTALTEPDALAVFIKGHHATQQQFILFCNEINYVEQIWHGSSIGTQAAVTNLGADLAYANDLLEQILPKLLINKEILYYPHLLYKLKKTEVRMPKWRKLLYKLIDQARSTQTLKSTHDHFPKIIKDLSNIIHQLRVMKSDAEIVKIREVTRVTAAAHMHIMQYVANHQDLTERHIQAEFYKFCLQHGCEDLAYPPIVASGNNACILHYTKNSAKLLTGELLLLDAGAELQYYAADVTRVCPINGKFSGVQRDLYQLVLIAQQRAINQVKPGVCWSKLQQTIIEILVLGLMDLKILSPTMSLTTHIEQGNYKQFYMHGSGHFLGLDVHDVGDYEQGTIKLAPGMILTIEPGLYIASHNTMVDPKWLGIGIRIEDDLLVTPTGHEILTDAAVKEIADIEHLMLN